MKKINKFFTLFLSLILLIGTAMPVYALDEEKIDLQNAVISFENNITEYEATGEAVKPAYNVMVGDILLTKDVDYTEKFENNIQPGTASLTITATDNSVYYKGSKTVQFTIVQSDLDDDDDEIVTPKPVSPPKAVKLLATYGKKKKSQLVVKWKTVSCDAYQIMYSKDASFKKGVKYVTVKGKNTSSKTVKVKNNNKKYFVRVRAIRYNTNKKPVYGVWSNKLNSSFTKTYAKYSSHYVNNRDRTTNLRIASKAIDGTVLAPGETFSFNETVGKRTSQKGYKKAHVFNGPNSTSMGIGGGVCQVASTIFNTVLFSNLKIVERHQHSQRVSYVPLGRDAAIYWPSQDLQFKNDTNYPIKIKMVVKDGVISCTFLTCQNVKPKKVKVTVSRSGKNFTMKRYAGGKCNYTTRSYY